MLKIIECTQNSPEWFAARCGIITASNFSDVLAKGQGKTRRSYLMKIVGEKITGTPAYSYINDHMERGTEQEQTARELYTEQTGNQIIKCGFMVDDSIGYSPDGLIGEDGLTEIKTRLSHLQIELLLSDKVPNENIAQIQGGLLVSGRKFNDYVSYSPGLPLFIKRVLRDEVYIDNLRVELKSFESEMLQTIEQIMGKF